MLTDIAYRSACGRGLTFALPLTLSAFASTLASNTSAQAYPTKAVHLKVGAPEAMKNALAAAARMGAAH